MVSSSFGYLLGTVCIGRRGEEKEKKVTRCCRSFIPDAQWSRDLPKNLDAEPDLKQTRPKSRGRRSVQESSVPIETMRPQLRAW